jgi:hypothetical protein
MIILGSLGLTILRSARGNTTLESAVTLTKALRMDIQSLGTRLAKAATAEEASRRKSNRAKSQAGHEKEIREIVQEIRRLLSRLEDAVPLFSLAITTSGASLSTTLPPSVSPSRMLQASAFLNAGDIQYSLNPRTSVQIGPTFTLTLYMLFAGHSQRSQGDEDTARNEKWKEVIHKARVKLMRIPLQTISHQHPNPSVHQGFDDYGIGQPVLESIEMGEEEARTITGEGKQQEYSYRLDIIEDLEDDRVHDFEDCGPHPEPYGDVRLAGVKEFLPVYQISKILYADTSKILNIGSQGELNSPVLLLKRDINALPPRRMMKEREKSGGLYDDREEQVNSKAEDCSQDDIDQQIRRESFVAVTQEIVHVAQSEDKKAWRLPADLDPEWLALEVYTEPEDSISEDEQDGNDDSAYISHRPSSSREAQDDNSLIGEFANLHINQGLSPGPALFTDFSTSKCSPYGPIRSSLSLLDMLIRLASLQQFQQASHLSIPDELLTFFLEESSTTGAGGNSEQRLRTRGEARRKVGFDPYGETPIKRRGQDYQYQNQGQDGDEAHTREGTPYEEYDPYDGYPSPQQRWAREQSWTPQMTPEPWSLGSRERSSSSQRSTPNIPPSPMSPYHPPRKATRPLDRVQAGSRVVKGSPLGRGMSVETDSTLGTSPGSPTPVNSDNRGERG